MDLPSLARKPDSAGFADDPVLQLGLLPAFRSGTSGKLEVEAVRAQTPRGVVEEGVNEAIQLISLVHLRPFPDRRLADITECLTATHRTSIPPSRRRGQ
jgi:hypothetical protein